MKKNNIILGVMIAGVSLLSLSSCGGKKKDESNVGSGSSTTTVEGGQTVETKYEVTFNSNGGTAVDSIEVSDGGKVTKPTDPTKATTNTEVFTFAGWYKDSSFAEVFDFENDTITDTTTLYAKWDVATRLYDVTFVVNGIETTTSYEYDSNITLPSTPSLPVENNGLYEITYNFVGWADEKNIEVTSASKVKSDIVIHPVFEIASIKLDTKVTASVDVTKIINENNLSDIMAPKYDMVSFYCVTSDKRFIFTYYIDSDDKIIPAYQSTSSIKEIDVILGKNTISKSYIYLPEVIKRNKENKINFKLEYDGTSFRYTEDNVVYVYSIEGYIIKFDKIDAVYDSIYEYQPDPVLIGKEKNATSYVLYDSNNPSRGFTANLVGKKWEYNAPYKNDDAEFLVRLLPLDAVSIIKTIMKTGDYRFDCIKKNNFYYLQFENKTTSITIQLDELGYVRTITINRVGNQYENVYICEPVGLDKVQLKPADLINALFNATEKPVGYINVEVSADGHTEIIDYYNIYGKFACIDNPFLAKYITELYDPNKKLEIIYILSLSSEFECYFDVNKNVYVLSGKYGEYKLTSKYDTYGQIVETILLNKNNDPLTSKATYDLGVYAPIRIINADDEQVLLPIDRPLDYIPTKEGKLIGDGSVYKGFVFDGYYMDENFKLPYDPNKVVLEPNMVIYAKFNEEIQQKIIWHTNPNNPKDVIINYQNVQGPITPIDKPLVDGYTFVGWFIDEQYEEPAQFEKGKFAEYFAYFIPDTYYNYEIIGAGKLVDIDKSLDSISSYDGFTYEGCLGILGEINRVDSEKGFETVIAKKTCIQFSVTEGATISYASRNLSDVSSVVVFAYVGTLSEGTKLSSNYYYFKGVDLVQVPTNATAIAGVEYWYLVGSDTSSSGKPLILEESVKPGKYMILQLNEAYLLDFSVRY